MESWIRIWREWFCNFLIENILVRDNRILSSFIVLVAHSIFNWCLRILMMATKTLPCVKVKMKISHLTLEMLGTLYIWNIECGNIYHWLVILHHCIFSKIVKIMSLMFELPPNVVCNKSGKINTNILHIRGWVNKWGKPNNVIIVAQCK